MPSLNELYPWSTVVRIDDTIGGVVHHGAGVLIATDEVLTAADVVWSASSGTATNITVTPGFSDGAAPFGQFTVDHYHYLPIDNRSAETRIDQQGDFALLHLSNPVPPLPVGSIQDAIDWTASFRGGPSPVGPTPTVDIVGYPDYAGGSTLLDRLVYPIDDGQGATLHEVLTAGLAIQGPLPDGPGVIGAPVLRANTGFGFTAAGVVVSGDRVAEISTPVGALIKQWLDADQSGAVQPSGAIAAAIPPLYHTITRDTGAIGVDPREALLVDPFSYLVSRPDVAAAGIDPAVHFAIFGWREGSSPDPLFDTKYYLSHNPDVAAAGMDPLLHYALFGWHEGRDPSASFSTNAYLATQQDVALAGVNPLEHYLLFGVEEGRAISPGAA